MLATELVIKCVTKEINWEICLRWGLRNFFYWLPFSATNVIKKKYLILVTITISQEMWGRNKLIKAFKNRNGFFRSLLLIQPVHTQYTVPLASLQTFYRKSDCAVTHSMVCCMGHSQVHFVLYIGHGFWRHAPYRLYGGGLRVEVCSKTASTVFTNIPTLA